MHCKRRWLPAWQRVELVSLCLDQKMSRREAARHRHVSVATVQYWIGRYRSASDAERATGEWAQDRPSTPHCQPARCSEDIHDRVCAERERTGWGPRLIAGELGLAHATVSRCLARRGISRMPRPAREQMRRFEWPCPGDLLQMDTKRLARFSLDPPIGLPAELVGRSEWLCEGELWLARPRCGREGVLVRGQTDVGVPR